MLLTKQKNPDFPFLVCLQVSRARKCLTISKYSSLQTEFSSTMSLRDTFFYYVRGYDAQVLSASIEIKGRGGE